MTKKGKRKLTVGLAVGIPVAILIAVIALIIKFGPMLGFWLIPPTPKDYGKAALETIQKNGIYATCAEWDSTYAEFISEFENAQSYEDTYETIRKALAIGGGKHSMLMSKSDASDTTQSYNEILPSVRMDGEIAVIKLPDFLGTAEAGKKYASVVEEFIHKNKDEIKGIILDLRDNTGGDMGPMACAVSSLLPEGELVYYHYRSYDIPVTLKDGVISNAGTGGTSLYPDEKLSVPVAILTNEMTASSGEALLLCFRGMDNVKTFGTPTAGYTSVNMLYSLYDGAQMFLTVAFDKARTGEIFEETSITPDVTTDSPLEDALEWLKES